jgi:hypothetical protein
MQDQLKALVSQTNPKGLPAALKADVELHQWVQEQTKSLPTNAKLSERIWVCLNQDPGPCKHNNRPAFRDLKTGYRPFCGIGNACPCRQEQHSKKIAESWSHLTAEERAARTQSAQHLNQPEVQAKARATRLERYGTETPFANAEIRAKAQHSYQTRTGYNSPLHNPVVQEKVQQTQIDRYGGLMVNARKALGEKYQGKNPFAVEEVKAKIRETNKRKYGTHSVKQSHLPTSTIDIINSPKDYADFINGKTLLQIQDNLGINTTTVSRIANRYLCRDLITTDVGSQWEQKIRSSLDHYNINYIPNCKTLISPLEVDFFLPNHNIAIEVNGLYWHSYSRRPDKNYHFSKWKLCREKGVDLYQWFDDDIRGSWPIIESKIQYLAGVEKPRIGARKCTLRKVSYQEAKMLFEKNHIQGAVQGQQYLLGAYYRDQLVGVMGFAHRRHYLELTRFATNLSATYPGLFSRMLKFSIEDLAYTGDIVSFSDNAHSNGAVYAANGFAIDKVLGPAYWYTNDYQTRHNRQNFMKSKIAKRFDIDMSNKTEWQAMQELGYDRIWDAGKIKWIKHT